MLLQSWLSSVGGVPVGDIGGTTSNQQANLEGYRLVSSGGAYPIVTANLEALGPGHSRRLEEFNETSAPSPFYFLPIKAGVLLPLDPSAAISSATLDLTAPFVPPPRRIQVSQAVARSRLPLRPTKTQISRVHFFETAPTLALQSDGVGSATLALTAPTQIPLDSATGLSTASLALTAPTRIVLNSSAATSTVTLALTAPAVLLGPASHGEGTEFLVIRTRASELALAGVTGSEGQRI